MDTPVRKKEKCWKLFLWLVQKVKVSFDVEEVKKDISFPSVSGTHLSFKWSTSLLQDWDVSFRYALCTTHVLFPSPPGAIQWGHSISKPFFGGDGNSTLPCYNSSKAICTEGTNVKIFERIYSTERMYSK